MGFETIHSLSGYIALIGVVAVIISGAAVIWRGIIKSPDRGLWLKAHKLSAGVFLGALLPHIATSTYTDWYFVGGAILLGLTVLIAALLPLFPTIRKHLVDLKVVILSAGLILLLIAHLRVD